MRKFSDDQMRGLLEGGTERRNLEFKEAFAWDNKNNSIWMQEQVTKAVLAMTNTLSGGTVVVGIKEQIDGNGYKTYDFSGVAPAQLMSFNDYDRIKGAVDGFAYSNTNFEIIEGQYKDNSYVLFNIQEFETIPVICRSNGQKKVLHQYAIYARSKRGYYSSIRATEVELQEMIHMAVDKEKKELQRRGYVHMSEAQQKKYDEQVKDLP